MKLAVIGIACLILVISIGFGGSKLPFLQKADKSNNQHDTKNLAAESETPAKRIAKLRNKKGDEFDKEYLNLLMENGQNSIDVANLAEGRAGHEEIKKWSKFVIETEPSSINTLKTLYGQWGFRAEDIKNNPDVH